MEEETKANGSLGRGQRPNVYKKLRRRLENNFLLGNDDDLGVFCREKSFARIKGRIISRELRN